MVSWESDKNWFLQKISWLNDDNNDHDDDDNAKDVSDNMLPPMIMMIMNILMIPIYL